jgi:hypothetical protein
MCTLLCIHIHVAVFQPARGCVFKCIGQCIHMHKAVYPCACGYVSMWSCIHMLMAMYPLSEFGYALHADGHVSTYTWLSSHMHVACIHVEMYHIMCMGPCINIQNLGMRYEP